MWFVSRYYWACTILNAIFLILNWGFGIDTFMGVKTGYLGILLLLAGIPIIVYEISYHRKKMKEFERRLESERRKFRGDLI